ncbi:MAG: rRNA maturation RNase YbeY [Firmicutes bacterium]|nr:rRNA maturation RNase YbeY [Bacillota bacterium]
MTVYWGKQNLLPMPTQTLLKQVISRGLRFHPNYKNVSCEINISFVTPTEMAGLNKQYRGKDAPTDVLSFPSAGAIPMPVKRRGNRRKPVLNLGDIVICPYVAECQALEYGHSTERELAFLTAHGLLHLLGYDHNTAPEEEAMIMMQKKILTGVGIER